MGSGYGIKFDAKRHLKFNEIKDTGKTKVWEVQNNHQHVEIGVIKWNGGWRKYCYYPYVDTMYDTKCLNRIIEFIEEKMEERKKKSR